MNAHSPTIRAQLSILAVAFIAACTHPSTVSSPEIPTSEPTRTATPQPALPEGNSSKEWQLSPTAEPQRYTSTITTSIQQSSGPTAVRDTITTRAQYDLSMSRSNVETSFTGSIQNLTVQAGKRIGNKDLTPLFPINFSGSMRSHDLQVDVTNPDHSSLPCEIPARTTLGVVQRNLFTTPVDIRAGMTWQDSLSSTTCSGSLELNLIILRTYKVIGESMLNGHSTIAIDINERTFSSGEGSQENHRIIVTGQGSRLGHLYLDTTTGLLLSLSSEIHTRLDVQISGITQQFTETSTELTNRM
jgi:hypothetical protein